MAKNRFLMHPTQTAPPLSSPHPYTLGVQNLSSNHHNHLNHLNHNHNHSLLNNSFNTQNINQNNTITMHTDDFEDDDICPVCDGECTCHSTPSFTTANQQQQQYQIQAAAAAAAAAVAPTSSPTKQSKGPLSMTELSLRYNTQQTHSPQPKPSQSHTHTHTLNSSSSGHAFPPSSSIPHPSLPRPPCPPTPTPTSTTTTANAAAPPPNAGAAPLKPSFKIKLTVPPSMLAKRRLVPDTIKSKNHVGQTMLDYGVDGYQSPNAIAGPSNHTPQSHTQAPAPKKRGRPPKALVALRHNANAAQVVHHAAGALSPPYKPLNPKSAAPGKAQTQSQKRSSSVKVRQNLKARAAVMRKGAPTKAGARAVVKGRRKRVVSSEEESSEDEDEEDGDGEGLVGVGLGGGGSGLMDDASSAIFPTFLSASALSSMGSSNFSSSSSSSSSSLSSFSDPEADSEIEAEEEHFILADVHDRTRVKRELLGEDNPPGAGAGTRRSGRGIIMIGLYGRGRAVWG
ncbi:hypothetical protein B0H34DRAFT_417607 [Crassisporium funariophilum]|nr:hypothetical protein B0H34DRAFT_417607 [Crassisporium funariophilum]